MEKRTRGGVTRPVYGPVPREVVDAKGALRDRLFAGTEAAAPEALAARRARRHHPAPAINLVGVGVGEKVTAGERTGELCVKVLVARKYPKGQIGRRDRIPAVVDGVPTDVEAVGYPRKFPLSPRGRYRPVPGGVSGSLDLSAVRDRYAGTLGLVVEDRRRRGTLYALSNNHVLADENRAQPGAPVVQPATLDGGNSRDRIGRLARSVDLAFGNRRNWMDAAIAVFDDAAGATRSILGIGEPVGAARPGLHLVVRKSGRTTGLTEGIIRVLNFDVVGVQYDQGLVRVDDVIVIEGTDGPFSKPGDSGSAIVDPRGRVVALLFAGSPAVTFAVPILRVLRRLGVRVAT